MWPRRGHFNNGSLEEATNDRMRAGMTGFTIFPTSSLLELKAEPCEDGDLAIEPLILFLGLQGQPPLGARLVLHSADPGSASRADRQAGGRASGGLPSL